MKFIPATSCGDNMREAALGCRPTAKRFTFVNCRTRRSSREHLSLCGLTAMCRTVQQWPPQTCRLSLTQQQLYERFYPTHSFLSSLVSSLSTARSFSFFLSCPLARQIDSTSSRFSFLIVTRLSSTEKMSESIVKG